MQGEASAAALHQPLMGNRGWNVVQANDTVKKHKDAPADSTRRVGRPGMRNHDGAPGRQGGPGANAPKKDEYKELLKKGGSVQKGVFTVRHIDNKWYFELPEKMMDRKFLVVTRFVNVPQGFAKLPGEEVNHNTVYFERRDDKTLFMRNYLKSQVADEKDQMALLVEKSTIDPIIMKFDIIGKDSVTGDHLVDVTNLFMQDNNISSFSQNDKNMVGLTGLMQDRTFIDTIKAFPTNIEVSTLRTYGATMGGGGGQPGAPRQPRSIAAQTGFITLSLNTSIVLLPEVPMQPRLEDERVGYFVNRFTTFSDDESSKHYAMAQRYRLEPKDPKAYAAGKLTEPKKQIVYYIDPATPKKWVPYLMKGINDWNVAFEAAGFKNAIVAKEVPAGSDISPDDARYSFLRYLPSETENAYGPRIVDPRSGEIIEAHVCWYHNVMNLVRKWYITQCGPLDKRAQKMQLDDKLMGELIRFVSSHEVGHTLGLRHNMISSHFTPVEKLRDKKWVEAHGHTYSIMDYARFNYVAQPEDHISEKGLFPRINDYDKWAIKWAYQYRPEFKDPYKERAALRKEVTEMLRKNPHVAYCGDEGRGQDPRSQTESIGDNNMKASDYGIKNLKRIMDNLEKWTAQPDGQYDDLREMHQSVRAQFQRYCGHVQRNILGRQRNTIPGMKPYEYTPKATQKEAIQWMGRNVFEAPLWLYPQSIIDKLGTDAEDEMMNRARTALAYLLNANLVTNQLKAGVYPIEEYLDDVLAAAWKPLDNANDKLNYYNRQLQRSYVNLLGSAINPKQSSGNQSQTVSAINAATASSDAVLYLLQHLDKLEKKVSQLANSGSGINGMHYKDLLLKIEKIKGEYNKVEK